MVERISKVLSRRTILAGTATVMTLPVVPMHAETRLRGPVAVEKRRALIGRTLANFGCAPPPEPVRDLSVEGAYTDSAYSKVDPEKLKRQQAQANGVGQFCWKVAQMSDLWVSSRPADPAPARCALAWMDAWAKAGALLGALNTPDAQHHRKWTLSGLSLAYLKIADAPGLDPAAAARVRAWFVRLADASEAYYATWPPSGHNNHFYWLALAMAGTAIAANDRARLDRAFAIYDEAAASITPEGALPLEMARKGRAFGYHVFSLIPLVMLAEIGTVNGRDLYGAHDGALKRLAARVQAGLGDQSWFAEQTGTPQDWTSGTTPYSVSWGEIYYPRFPNPELGALIAPRRPIFSHWLGGSVTESFGSSALPFPS